MRIVSKFSDYYDGAQSYDKDDLTYLRLQTKKHLRDVIDLGRYYSDADISSRFSNTSFQEIRIIAYAERLIGFCGKIYPVLTFYYHSKNEILPSFNFYPRTSEQSTLHQEQIKKVNIKKTHFLTQSSLDDFLTSYKMKILTTRFGHGSDGEEMYGKYFKKRIKRIHENKEKYESLFFKLNVPLFIIYNEFNEESDLFYHCYRETHIWIETNPRLKDFDFNKIIDPYTAFQEISMFIGGALSKPERPMLVISDEIKAAQHGYDQYSFKTMRGDKKPRNQNRNKKNS